MRPYTAAALAVALLAPTVFAQGVSSGTNRLRTADGGTIAVQAAEIEGVGSDKIVLRENARTKLFDKSGVLVFDAQADKIIVTLFRDSGKKTSGEARTADPTAETQRPPAMAVKFAELIGSPRIVYTSKDPVTGVITTTTATGKSATFDGVAQIAHLKGSVKIINENPELFEGPAVMTGDEAMMNLKNPLGPEDVRFRIKSNAPTVSTIQATPKETALKKTAGDKK